MSLLRQPVIISAMHYKSHHGLYSSFNNAGMRLILTAEHLQIHVEHHTTHVDIFFRKNAPKTCPQLLNCNQSSLQQHCEIWDGSEPLQLYVLILLLH